MPAIRFTGATKSRLTPSRCLPSGASRWAWSFLARASTSAAGADWASAAWNWTGKSVSSLVHLPSGPEPGRRSQWGSPWDRTTQPQCSCTKPTSATSTQATKAASAGKCRLELGQRGHLATAHGHRQVAEGLVQLLALGDQSLQFGGFGVGAFGPADEGEDAGSSGARRPAARRVGAVPRVSGRCRARTAISSSKPRARSASRAAQASAACPARPRAAARKG